MNEAQYALLPQPVDAQREERLGAQLEGIQFDDSVLLEEMSVAQLLGADISPLQQQTASQHVSAELTATNSFVSAHSPHSPNSYDNSADTTHLPTSVVESSHSAIAVIDDTAQQTTSIASFKNSVLERHYCALASPSLRLANSTFRETKAALAAAAEAAEAEAAEAEAEATALAVKLAEEEFLARMVATSVAVITGRATHAPPPTDEQPVLIAKQEPLRVAQQFKWERAFSHWRGDDDELYLPHNAMFVANTLPAVGRKSFDSNINHLSHYVSASAKMQRPSTAPAPPAATEYIFVVRVMLHNVNIVTGSFTFVKKPLVISNRGLLSRISFMLTSNTAALSTRSMSSLAEMYGAEGGSGGKRQVERFESSIRKNMTHEERKAARYGDIHYCSPVTTTLPAASTATPTTSTVVTSSGGHNKSTASASAPTAPPQQLSEVIGALNQELLAVFVFNGRVYYRPLREIEFLCVSND